MNSQLIEEYKQLLNERLPSAYTYPVRYNHCFNRIVLDWLFKDCWYNHLEKNKPAVSQLTQLQMQSAVNRMKEWLQHQELLIEDNKRSLQYRKKLHDVAH